MNAYELADYLDCELENAFPHHQETIEMLRQQADRIAELEKGIPDGLIDPKSYYIGYEDGKKAPQTKCLDCGKVNPAEIHTCSPQTKLLSDEEISGIWEGLFENEDDIVHIHNFARAIEAKVRGEK